jgi:hypothetical protein
MVYWPKSDAIVTVFRLLTVAIDIDRIHPHVDSEEDAYN